MSAADDLEYERQRATEDSAIRQADALERIATALEQIADSSKSLKVSCNGHYAVTGVVERRDGVDILHDLANAINEREVLKHRLAEAQPRPEIKRKAHIEALEWALTKWRAGVGAVAVANEITRLRAEGGKRD